jgi:transketolase
MLKSINAIRFTGLDMIDEANSGHPGIVLGAAPILYTLFKHHLMIDPKHPSWFNRDRFILSAGHGSALLYALLHVSGFNINIEDLKQFRKLHSITPGHPEYAVTEGVDMTTGPLGQGIAHAVGLAIAESHLRARFNQEKYPLVDHYTYVLVGDGDLQEGVTFEALSLAGHLKLNRLIVLFDSNDVQLDGPVSNASSMNVEAFVSSLGFNYLNVDDANDTDSIDEAITSAKESSKPTFIEIKSKIGFGSSKEGTSNVHGAPLGLEETARLRDVFEYKEDRFEIASDVYEDFKNSLGVRGSDAYKTWKKTLKAYFEEVPEKDEFKDILENNLPSTISKTFALKPHEKKEATRISVGNVLLELFENYPALMGGSADLSGSTKVKGIDGPYTKNNRIGRNLNFGVREHAMAAIANGLTLHHLRGVAGGFFTFSDYMKPSIRLAALMGIPSLYIFTHDSVAVGEDGPTHQPIEHLAQFRSLPGIQVLRPADKNESLLALRLATETLDKPSIIVASRQDLKPISEPAYDTFKMGAYLLKEATDPKGVLIASGSEVSLCLEAANVLKETHQIDVDVVSVPSLDLFLSQDASKQASIIKKNLKVLAVEMGSPDIWYRLADDVMGLSRFGESGDGDTITSYLGFNVEAVVERFKSLI